MPDKASALAGIRAAVEELSDAAQSNEATWTTPTAPGKWSPSQLTEHVARTLDECAHVVAGEPHKFPRFPFFVRPVFRGLFFNRTVRKGTFPKAKTFKDFDPETGPPSPGEARQRLDAAMSRFEEACEECADGGSVTTSTFGSVSVEDYVRFNELHVRHHRKQLPN